MRVKTSSRRATISGFALGLVLLASPMTLVARTGDLERYRALLREAAPPWFILALASQTAIYVVVASGWSLILARGSGALAAAAGASRPREAVRRSTRAQRRSERVPAARRAAAADWHSPWNGDGDAADLALHLLRRLCQPRGRRADHPVVPPGRDCTATLHLLGVPLEGAVAGTLMFRLISLWLPLVPGIAALHRIGRGKVIR